MHADLGGIFRRDAHRRPLLTDLRVELGYSFLGQQQVIP